jgi:hypothetical protein
MHQLALSDDTTMFGLPTALLKTLRQQKSHYLAAATASGLRLPEHLFPIFDQRSVESNKEI